jgi:transcriptional regulator with XRE-family HTH domain
MSAAGTRAILSFIAANIRARRVRQGMTQEQMAEDAGLDLRHYQRIERGTMNITIAVLVAIADALLVKPAVLFRPAKLGPAMRGRPRSRGRKRLAGRG